MLRGLGLIILMFLVGCSGALVSETPSEPIQTTIKRYDLAQLLRDPNHLMIDTREPHAFALGPWQGAVNWPWSSLDSLQLKPGAWFALRQRLNQHQVGPETGFLILTETDQRQPAALAWALTCLGASRVELMPRSGEKPKSLSRGRVSVSTQWGKRCRIPVVVTKEALKQELGAKNLVILDVRSEKDYLTDKSLWEPYLSHGSRAINIHWPEFFEKEGTIRLKFRKTLNSLGFRPSDSFVVVSRYGIDSAAVAFALLKMGFRDVRSLAEGTENF